MGKYLLLFLLGVVAYLLWKGLRRNAGRQRDAEDPRSGERMVDCSQCGVHLPVSDAVGEGGRFFCSEEHRRLFRQ
jgi:uncharacterized protein